MLEAVRMSEVSKQKRLNVDNLASWPDPASSVKSEYILRVVPVLEPRGGRGVCLGVNAEHKNSFSEKMKVRHFGSLVS